MDPELAGRRAAQEQRLNHLRESGLLPSLEQWAKRMTAPVWWDERTADGVRRWGGTICVVDTGQRLLGITAAHVHDHLAACLGAGRTTHCQAGAHVFDPRRCLIDRDTRLDVATYSLSRIQVDAMDVDVHSAVEWPPSIPRPAAFIVGGWPSELRESRPREVSHYFAHYIARLSDATDENLVIVLEPETSRPWGKARIPPGTNLGGMSGGPVYAYDERGPIAALTLVGIVSEYSSLFAGVLGRPLSLVSADGSIRAEARHGGG